MNAKFDALKSLGAGDFEHLNGKLITHLEKTRDILIGWGGSSVLCDAGLYHAAYGTDGFDASMVDLSRRADIANIIGIESEELVYLYCSCDRGFVFPKLGLSNHIREALINYKCSLAYKLFHNQGVVLQTWRVTSKNNNAECGIACRPHRARPEAGIFVVAVFAKDYGHCLQTAPRICPLQTLQRMFIINQSLLRFKDRFLERQFSLSDEQSKLFCELTVANEMELVLDNKTFNESHGKKLLILFESMKKYLSPHAIDAYRRELITNGC